MNPNNQKYKLLKEIGNGSFGKVYLAEDQINKKKVAIKRIEKKKIVNNTYLHKAFWKEIEIMKKCNCKNSVEFIELLQTQNNYNVVMELCDTDLHNYLYSRQNGFSTEEIRKILTQLNTVFKIMHSYNIMHRDLKLKNIMITFLNKQKTNYEVKLCDYGFSKSLDDSLVTSTHLGTPATMAPEVISDKKYSTQADLWSIGIIIYQLLFKDLPYFGFNEKQVLTKILSKVPIKQPEDPLLKDLLNKLLVIEPEKRITWDEYFKHPFFKEGNNNNNNNKVNDISNNSLNGNKEKKNNNNNSNNNNNNKNDDLRIKGKYKIIKEFNNGIDIPDFKIYIGKEISSNKLYYIKQYSLSFTKKYNKEIQYEITLSNIFQDNQHSLQYYLTEYDDKYCYMLYDYIEGESLKEYIKKNDIDEQKLRKMNLDFYENIIIFLSVNPIHFNILSLYNFLVNKKGELVLFDFGLIFYLLPDNIKKQYFISSPNEINKISGKSNILNYGITLFKIYYKDENDINVKDKIIIIPSSKPMSKEFMSFISKCIYRNIDKRHSWNSFPLDTFVYSISDNKEYLLNKNYLEIIINGLDYRFQFILDYYNSIDFNEPNNRKFIKEIGLFLMISFIELKTIRTIFHKILEKKNDYTKEEEISFVQINKDSSYDFITYNLGSIPINKKIYNGEKCSLIESFINKIKTILSGILKNCVRLRKIDKLACPLGENPNVFIRKLMESFYNSDIQNYFYFLTQEGVNYFDSKDLNLSNKQLTIAEFLCEYIIFMKTFSTDNNKNLNNFNLINNFFESKQQQICISTVFLKEENDKYLFISFLGGMFRYYYNQLNNEEARDLMNESVIKKTEKAFDGLIQFYPSLMKMVIESKV